MKVIPNIIFFVSLAGLGCKRSSPEKPQDHKPTDSINAKIKLGTSESQPIHELPKDRIEIDSLESEKHIASEKFIKEGGNPTTEARLAIRKKLESKTLNREQTEEINDSINDKPVLSASPDIQIKTPAEAFERINFNLAMASPPEVFSEDAIYYYFSGGLSNSRVDDFSSGIRISKIGGIIHVWERRK